MGILRGDCSQGRSSGTWSRVCKGRGRPTFWEARKARFHGCRGLALAVGTALVFGGCCRARLTSLVGALALLCGFSCS